MKTNSTRVKAVQWLLCLPLVFLSFLSSAQPDYKFKNPTLISGTALQIGAKYRFSNVKPNVDGIITIVDIKKISLNNIDGPSGFDDAFQPYIQVPKKTNGYVEFQLDFVAKNTTTPVAQVEVPMTAIDIDGYIYPDEKIYEFDEFQTSPSYYVDYDMVGTSLDVKFQAGWVQAINKNAVEYPGIDTIQRDVMFTMVHANVSSVVFRVGADNKSNTSTQRLRSVYFQKFNLGNVILAKSPLESFAGKQDSKNINLQWKFSSVESIRECVLERSANGKDFTAIHRVAYPSYSNSYLDANAAGSNYSYRLRIVENNDNSTYSQVILFKANNAGQLETLNIYPNVIQSRASVQVYSGVATKSQLQVVDYNGRILYKETVQLSPGSNSFNLDVTDKVAKGNYLVVMPIEGKMISQKIIIN